MTATPVTSDELAGAVYDYVDGDATLIGSTCFNAALATCLFLGPRRPEGFPAYAATIAVQFNNFNEVGFQDATALLNVYLPKLGKGSHDAARFDAIIARFVQLLHDARDLSVPGKTLFYVRFVGQTGPSWDPEDPNEHYVTLRFRLWAAGTAT